MTPDLLVTPLTPITAIQGWHEYLADGDGYLKTALQAHSKKRTAFTAAILYNIIAMAIEKFVMAALMCRGTLPDNHTMEYLVAAMDGTFPGTMAGIREGLLALDQYQEICAVETFKISGPAMAEIAVMLELAGRLQELVTAILDQASAE